ncbi:Tn7-like element transposition protein TnsE [Microbulbifer thermotolerans]|uniref:Tn7-like element transposition protein TnsE n=1 Tax=Microbulbifer thermotolerans TaxID=252514 RepID=UPI003461F042
MYYLLARFGLPNDRERYLLEVDTSENCKCLSTRVVEFDTGIDDKKAIAVTLRSTIKASLPWIRTIAK